MFKNYIGWHLELTQRCPLACPACDRTMFYETVNPKLDINTDHVKKFFTTQHLQNLQYMQLQGNLGDPIYHPNFHEIAEHFFPVNYLNVTTNGMHKIEFWQRVLETWPSSSEITLSIDGLEDTNHMYRINSKWYQIQELFDLIAKQKHKCLIEWKYIVFEHNHHQVEQAEKIANKIGINKFRIQKTRPLDTNIVKEYHNPDWFTYVKPAYEDSLVPFCLTGDMHYIDAHGDYYPCCWWEGQNKNSKQYSPLNIANNTIADFYKHFVGTKSLFADYETAPCVCKKFCRKIKNNNKEKLAVNTQLNRKVINL